MEELFYRANPWWEEEYRFEGIERERYLAPLKRHLGSRDILFLTGLRRVGKTSLLKNLVATLLHEEGIVPKEIFYISLDLYALEHLSIAEILRTYRAMHKLPSSRKVYLFFDEVTAKPHYAQELKNLYDLENVKIFASSSSASLLKDRNAYLTGRQRIIEVQPLDFDEYLLFREITVKRADSHLLEAHFKDYMEDGGMPEYVLTGEIDYLQNLVDTIVYKDIIAHHRIKNEQVIRDFYRLLMERSGKQLSLNRVAKILDIGVDSARRYLGYFEESYLIYTVEKYGKLNERIKNPKKVYAGDVGLRNVVTGFRDLGAVFENLLFLLIRPLRPSYVYEEGIELDFMTEGRWLIEAKYHSTLNEKQRRLFERIDAREKIVIDSPRAFLEFRSNANIPQ